MISNMIGNSSEYHQRTGNPGCSGAGVIPSTLKIKHVKLCSPWLCQLKGKVRHLHHHHVWHSCFTAHLVCCDSIMATADVISQDILLSPDLPDNGNKLVGDGDVEELSQEGQERSILWFFVIDCVHNCIIITEHCDCLA